MAKGTIFLIKFLSSEHKLNLGGISYVDEPKADFAL